MTEYEAAVYETLEFGDSWEEIRAGVKGPKCLSDLSYLRGTCDKKQQQRKKLSGYLGTFRSFKIHFKDVDQLLDAMRDWSKLFKTPATSFSHDEHPQQAEFSAVLSKIEKDMSSVNLSGLHDAVMANTFSAHQQTAAPPATAAAPPTVVTALPTVNRATSWAGIAAQGN
jgi:hypothetical protein